MELIAMKAAVAQVQQACGKGIIRAEGAKRELWVRR
jgi:hypothetical protein